MADIEKEEKDVKEETPAWAKTLMESLDSLPSRLKEALTPEQQEETPSTEPAEIPVPQPQPPEQPPQPQEVETEPQEVEKPKKKNLLDWLL